MAHVVHVSEGRARLRFAGHRGAAEPLLAIATQLGKLDGVRAAEVRPFTGSILVLHDGDFDKVAGRAVAAGLFDLGEARTMTEARPGAFRRPLPALTALAFTGLGVMQLLENRVLPPALTLFWYAASLAREAASAQAEEAVDE